MGNIAGYVEVLVKKNDGEQEEIVVNGEDFGWEDGGWSRDRDDGERHGDLLYKAFLKDFSLQLVIVIHGTRLQDYNLSVTDKNFEADVQVDELDISGLFESPDDEDD